MLTMLPLRVGTEWVEGVMAANDSEGGVLLERDAVVAAAAFRIAAIRRPGTSLMILSFSILWSSRPILVSSSSIRPHSSAFASASAFTISTTFARGSDAFLLELQEAGLRGGAGFVGVLENAVLAAAEWCWPQRGRCRRKRMLLGGAGAGRGFCGRGLSQTAKDLRDHVTDSEFR